MWGAIDPLTNDTDFKTRRKYRGGLSVPARQEPAVTQAETQCAC